MDRRETPAVFRDSTATFYFRHTHSPGVADAWLSVGRAGWPPVAGEFESG